MASIHCILHSARVSALPVDHRLRAASYCFDLRWELVKLWQNLTLTQDLFFTNDPVFPPILTPLWSLPLELEMYLVLPASFLVFRNRSLRLLMETWALSTVIAFIQPQMGDRFFMLRFIPCFVGGVIAWRLLRDCDRTRFPGWLWPFAIATVSVIWIVASGEYLPLGIAIFGLSLGLPIPLFRENQWGSVTTSSRIVARYSYGIYLAHFPILLFVLNDPRYPHLKVTLPFPRLKHHAGPVDPLLVVLLTATAAFGLYHLLENPGIRVGHKLAKWTAPTHAEQALPLASSP